MENLPDWSVFGFYICCWYILGNEQLLISTLRGALLNMESNIPSFCMHGNWPLLMKPWQTCVGVCSSPRDFIRALTVICTCIKPVAFNAIFSDALGHTKITRSTLLQREKQKKEYKRLLKDRDLEEERNRVFWVKYTRGLKHQVITSNY